MKLLTIAKKNIKKNSSFYFLYLFSVSFVLMVFFSFISFSMDEVIIESISSDGRVEAMSKVVGILIMAFVLFYMSYSNTFFMKRRMKELGIYALLGYRKSTMIRLLSWENFLICTSALGIGIILGAFLHKFIVIVIVHALGLQIDTMKIPLINFNAVLLSFIFVLAVLFILLLSNWRFLKKSSLLTLVRLDKKGEKQIQSKIWLAILGLILLIIGYASAFNMTRGNKSLWVRIGFYPMAMITLISVVVGTIFFIHSFIPYIMFKLKDKKNYFYKETNIITIPKFIYRIRSNSRTLILLTLLSAATLSILGSTLLTMYYPIAGLSRIIPAAYEFPVNDVNKVNEALNILKQTVGEENIDFKKTSLIQITSSSKNLPYEYTAKEKHSFDLISKSEYIKLLQLQGEKSPIDNLNENEVMLVKYSYSNEDSDTGNSYTLNITDNNKTDVKVIKTTLMNPIGFANSMGTLVISDELYERIYKYKLPVNEVMSIYGNNLRENEEVYNKLSPLFKDNIYFASAFQKNHEFIHENSSTLLLIIFATAIFFIATGSILYFHNISGITYDKSEFSILKKMGYGKKKIQKIISNQVLILFIIPYILGVVHSIFALLCFKSALMQDLLGNNSAFFLPIGFSIGIFTTIYILYYIITKYMCFKILSKNNI